MANSIIIFFHWVEIMKLGTQVTDVNRNKTPFQSKADHSQMGVSSYACMTLTLAVTLVLDLDIDVSKTCVPKRSL